MSLSDVVSTLAHFSETLIQLFLTDNFDFMFYDVNGTAFRQLCVQKGVCDSTVMSFYTFTEYTASHNGLELGRRTEIMPDQACVPKSSNVTGIFHSRQREK